MSLPTPNYVLEQELIVNSTNGDKTLPAGAFVRPIELRYVPKYITEMKLGNLGKFNSSLETYCFTHWGIVRIPLNMIRKVSP